MSRSTRIGRFLAAATLAVAATAVFAGSPASAANTNLTQNCVTQYQNAMINNSDTVTITISGSSCGYAVLMGFMGPALGTMTQNGNPVISGNPFPVANNDVLVYTAPASGSGNETIGFPPTLQAQPNIQINVTFPVPTPRTGDSMVDNGNGSMTVTFEPLANSQNVFVSFFPAGTSCPSTGTGTGRLFVISSSSIAPSPLTSPAVISAGSTAYNVSNGVASPLPIPAGSYQACMNFSPGNGPSFFEQGLAITLGEVTPDPVAPAFTG